MSAVKIQVQMGGLLARLTLSRPEKYNAFDREMLRELGDLLRGVTESEKLRVLLITGEGKAFCAGADLQAAAQSESVSSYLGALAKGFNLVIDHLASSPALVVTLVNGAAAGGGFALAVAGDVRLALPEGAFRLGYGRVGLTMDGGLSWRLPRLVGATQAQRLIFEDPDIDADEAHALGLVHHVVPPSEVEKTIQALVERMKIQSRGSILRNRQLLLDGQGRALAASFEAEATAMKLSAGTADGREGVAAFVEKRPPKFTS